MLELTKLSSAVKYSQDIVFITDDRGGTIEYVNPSFTRITGYSEEEAVGKKPSIISYFNKGKRLFPPEIIKAINSKGIYSKVVFNKKKDGEAFYYDQTVVAIRNDQDQITNFISTGKDITKRMNAENELKENIKKNGRNH